jgi:6-phosphogluconate dehydrogenase
MISVFWGQPGALATVSKLIPLLTEDDVVIDGGNSFYKDTLRRNEMLTAKGIHFMDIGTSGGPAGARNGACLMVGGSQEDYDRVLPLLQAAAAPNAYGHFGKVGAGHFAKMVHNGIEYGMMEAIAEGLAILDRSGLIENIAEVFRVYNNKSVIESRLVGWTEEALLEDPKLTDYNSKIDHTGEGEWTVRTAVELGVGVPVLDDSFQVRVESENVKEDSADGYRNKAVSAMRGKFGGHAVKK